jgi:hypothetical protein
MCTRAILLLFYLHSSSDIQTSLDLAHIDPCYELMRDYRGLVALWLLKVDETNI